MTTDTALATTDTASPAELARVVESLVVRGDISQLSTADRSQYYLRMCASLGLNPTTQPLAFLKLNGKDVLYVTRSATDQLAAMHRVNREIIDGPKVIDLGGTKAVYAVCRATLPNGRVETATAAIPATDLINSVMKVETKAKRRATLSILGLGVSLDESELDTIAASARGESAPSPAPAVPAAITAATTCAAVGAAYRGAVDGTDPSDPALTVWRDDCLTAAMATLAALGVHLSQADYRRVLVSPDLAALCDEVLGLASAGRADVLPGWWIQGEAALSTLPGDDRGVLGRLVARLWRRLGDDAPAAHVTAAGRAFVAERDALRSAARTREPGDDDDDPSPGGPQGPRGARRTSTTVEGTTGPATMPATEPRAQWEALVTSKGHRLESAIEAEAHLRALGEHGVRNSYARHREHTAYAELCVQAYARLRRIDVDTARYQLDQAVPRQMGAAA